MRFVAVIIFLFCSFPVVAQTYSADNLFETFSRSIYQIKIIDIESGSQSSIGSGFVVVNGFLLATNYHVVSPLIHQARDYRGEIIIDGKVVELVVDTFDVVRDLALLKPKNNQFLGRPLILSKQAINKGKPLFSIGNPHDLGMTVVEGTYNGFVEHQFIDLIHFSGAINPGMSGGPVINTAGEVVGINVATSGDQIGFLVPVDALQTLINQPYEVKRLRSSPLIQTQIAEFTTAVINQLLLSPWVLDTMGDAQVLGAISNRMECWGNSQKNEDNQLETISKGCTNNDSIYIESGFTTGVIEYEFEYQQASNWHSLSFYHHMTNNLLGVYPGNHAGEKQVGAYRCQVNIVSDEKQNIDKKLNYCVRPYLTLDGLFDVFYLAASIDKKEQMLIEHYTLAGVTEEAANRFLTRFIGEAAKWQ